MQNIGRTFNKIRFIVSKTVVFEYILKKQFRIKEETKVTLQPFSKYIYFVITSIFYPADKN